MQQFLSTFNKIKDLSFYKSAIQILSELESESNLGIQETMTIEYKKGGFAIFKFKMLTGNVAVFEFDTTIS